MEGVDEQIGAHNGGGGPAPEPEPGSEPAPGLVHAPGSLCERCGADLGGLRAGRACPSCGASQMWPVWDERPLPEWCRCTHCGYPVGGLGARRRCSECGAPAVWALQHGRVRFMRPGVIRSMARGASMVFWGYIVLVADVAAVVVVALGMIFQSLQGPAGSGGGMPAWFGWGVGGVGLVFLVGAVMMVVGWWRLTTPEGTGRRAASARWTRAGLLMMLLVVPVGVAGGVSVARYGMTPVLPLGAVLLFYAGRLVYLFASLFYVRYLAQRMLEQGLRSFAVGCLIMCPMATILGSCFYGMGDVVSTALYIVLLGWLARALKREEARAKRLGEIAERRLGSGTHAVNDPA